MTARSDNPTDAGAFDDMAYRRARHAERSRTKPQRIIALAVGIGAVVTYGRLALKTEGSDAFAGPQPYVWIVVACVLIGIFVMAWRVDLDPDLRDQRRAVLAQRRAGRRLGALSRHGWVVLHDRRVGATGPTIQHLLIGPVGVFVVTSTTPRSRMTRTSIRPTTEHAAALLQDRLDVPVRALEWSLPPLASPLAGRRLRHLLQADLRGPADSTAEIEAHAQACLVWCPPRLARDDVTERSAG